MSGPQNAGASNARHFARVSAVTAALVSPPVHGTGPRAPMRYAINATLLSTATPDGPRWLFQDVHQGGPAQEAGIRAGDLLLAVNGQRVEPPSLLTFALGEDHAVTVESCNGQSRTLQVVLPEAEANGKAPSKPPMAEPASVTARAITPAIGHLRVAFFPGVNGQKFARALDAALAELPDCTRLIVDLRGNLGGFVGSLRLMSYLTRDRVPVGYSLTRRGEDAKWRPEDLPCIDKLPATTLDMVKMALRFKVIHRDRSILLVTEGLGPQPFHGSTDARERAHLKCWRDGGRVREAESARDHRRNDYRWSGPGRGELLGRQRVYTSLPGSWVVLVGRPNRGGRGVSPDVEVPLSSEELRNGRDNQLEAAIEAVEKLVVRAASSGRLSTRVRRETTGGGRRASRKRPLPASRPAHSTWNPGSPTVFDHHHAPLLAHVKDFVRRLAHLRARQ